MRMSAGIGRASNRGRSFELRIMDGLGIEMVKTLNRPLSQQQNPNRLEPTRKPRLDLLERDELKTKPPSMWDIVFYNDDYTPMDFVEFVVKTVFHRSVLDALAFTLAVHTKGKGIAGTYTFEIAEQKQCEVLLMAKTEEHPLRVEVERA
jgi:ATP-dependent Clp protease adaptor protein ClpS